MLKWYVGAGILLLLIAAAVRLQYNSVKVSYINGLPKYTDLPGREFIFEQDCYIFEFRDHHSEWPLVASHQTVPALPAIIDPKLIGTDVPQVRLLALARTGDRFRIVSVRRDDSRHGSSVTFEVLFADEANRPYPRIDTFWIMDHSPERQGLPPTILASFAVPRVKD